MTTDAVKRLATAISLAARIEPELVRAARLRLFPDMDVSAEGDLWFSDLVASRSARRVVLDPEIVSSMRESLADEPELLAAARAVILETHRNAPPAIRLEEEIVYLALTRTDVEDAINTKLTSVLNAIANEGRRGLIDWAARALPGMPAIVQNTTAAAALRLVAGGQASDALQVSRDPAIATLVSRAVPKTKVFARLVPQHDGLSVEISRTELPASHEIELPKTEPLVLELATLGHTEVVDVPHEGTLLRETDGAVSIRTMTRDVFFLEELREDERTTVRILVMTGLSNAALPDEQDIDVVLIAGNLVKTTDDRASAFARTADELQGRFKAIPIFAVPGPDDGAAAEFSRFRGFLGFTSDEISFAKSLEVRGIRLGVVGIDTSRGEFEASPIFNACDGDPLAWARAHHVAILLTYSAPEHLDNQAPERWRAFGTSDVFDLIATGSANTPRLPEGYVIVELPDPDGGALVSIHRHGERQIRRQAIHPRMDGMPPAQPRRVLVAGIAEGLPIALQELCRAIGSLLALQGHDLLTGGWPGVDHLVAKGFDEAAPHRIESLSHYLGGLRKEPDYKRGRPVYFDREEDALREAVRNADVVILIEGAEGTRSVGVEAISQGKPVIPIGGGAAAELRDIAIRPGRWPDDAAGLLRRLNRVPIWRSQDFVEGLPATFPEQANVATIAHDVNELIRVARPLERDLLEKVFISYSDDSLYFTQFEYYAEQLIVDHAMFSRDIASLSLARFAVVFIGPGYLEDSRKRDELRRIIERATAGYLTIFWFLESRCDYASTGIDRFMAAHDVTKPLDTLSIEEFNEVYDVAAKEFANQVHASMQHDEPPVGEEEPPEDDREDTNIGVRPSTHRLVDVATGTAFILSRADETTIGRADPVTGIFPDIDLTAVDTSRSINRKHAKIVRSGSEYFLVEEFRTMNGTYMNDQRISAGQPVGVHDGDLIQIGLVKLKAVLDDDRRKTKVQQNTELHTTTKATRPVAEGFDVSTPPHIVDVATGTKFFLSKGDETTIGRADPVTGILPDIDLTPVDTNRSVSRRHAKIIRSESEYSLMEEVGTVNGTFVNDQRIPTGTPVTIHDGDSITIGLIKFKVRLA